MANGHIENVIAIAATYCFLARTLQSVIWQLPGRRRMLYYMDLNMLLVHFYVYFFIAVTAQQSKLIFHSVLATGVCKKNSLFPWMVALITDASSHVLLQRSPQSSGTSLPPYNPNERNELRRRYINLIYYLMRSPVYERYTE